MRPLYSFLILGQLIMIVVRLCGYPMKWYIMFAPVMIMIICSIIKYRRQNYTEFHFKGKKIKSEWAKWYDVEDNRKN